MDQGKEVKPGEVIEYQVGHPPILQVEHPLISSALNRIETMKEYLLMKFHEGDWHGCQDAASDLRDLESYIEGVKATKEENK